MKTIFTTPKMALVKTALVSGLLMAVAPGIVTADPMEKKGTTPYVTHFIFRPVQSLEVTGLGTATLLEAVGNHPEHEGREDARQDVGAMYSVECLLRYREGHRLCLCSGEMPTVTRSASDTRDVDKSQPTMNCGTHIITGGTGKYKGITGSEPFACNGMPALAGAGGYTAMDIPHNTTWEIKGQ